MATAERAMAEVDIQLVLGAGSVVKRELLAFPKK
jgi:hypothetical protein